MDQNVTREVSDNWVIVLAAGRALVGRPDGICLSPVYDFMSGSLPAIAQTPKGPAVVVATMTPNAAPVLGLASIRKVYIPDGAIVIPLSDLSEGERDAVMKAVDAVEESVRQFERRAKLAAEVEGGAGGSVLVKP